MHRPSEGSRAKPSRHSWQPIPVLPMGHGVGDAGADDDGVGDGDVEGDGVLDEDVPMVAVGVVVVVGVGVAEVVKLGVGVADTVVLGVGVGEGVRLGVADWLGEGVMLGVGEMLGVGVGVGVREDVGEGLGVVLGVGLGVGSPATRTTVASARPGAIVAFTDAARRTAKTRVAFESNLIASGLRETVMLLSVRSLFVHETGASVSGTKCVSFAEMRPASVTASVLTNTAIDVFVPSVRFNVRTTASAKEDNEGNPRAVLPTSRSFPCAVLHATRTLLDRRGDVRLFPSNNDRHGRVHRAERLRVDALDGPSVPRDGVGLIPEQTRERPRRPTSETRNEDVESSLTGLFVQNGALVLEASGRRTRGVGGIVQGGPETDRTRAVVVPENVSISGKVSRDATFSVAVRLDDWAVVGLHRRRPSAEGIVRPVLHIPRQRAAKGADVASPERPSVIRAVLGRWDSAEVGSVTGVGRRRVPRRKTRVVAGKGAALLERKACTLVEHVGCGVVRLVPAGIFKDSERHSAHAHMNIHTRDRNWDHTKPLFSWSSGSLSRPWSSAGTVLPPAPSTPPPSMHAL